MTTEYSIELQNIDCNCNNCVHMVRDLEEWKKWHDYHKANALVEYEKRKAKAFKDAEALEDQQAKKTMLYKANKLRFMFDKSGLISYGNCTRLGKPLSFIPETCMIENQGCFENRRKV